MEQNGCLWKDFYGSCWKFPGHTLLMIDATHLKAHRTAASLRKKGLLPDVSDEQREDWTPNCMRSVMPWGVLFGHCWQLALSVITLVRHTCCPVYLQLQLFLPTGAMMRHGFASIWKARTARPAFQLEKNTRSQDNYDKKLYCQRHKIENMFARLKDWRRIAMRYDRCAHTFLSAIHIAAIVIFYL